MVHRNEQNASVALRDGDLYQAHLATSSNRYMATEPDALSGRELRPNPQLTSSAVGRLISNEDLLADAHGSRIRRPQRR